MLNKKLVKSMKEEMRKNEHLKLILDKLVSMGMSEDEALDFMISAWVNRINQFKEEGEND